MENIRDFLYVVNWRDILHVTHLCVTQVFRMFSYAAPWLSSVIIIEGKKVKQSRLLWLLEHNKSETFSPNLVKIWPKSLSMASVVRVWKIFSWNRIKAPRVVENFCHNTDRENIFGFIVRARVISTWMSILCAIAGALANSSGAP